MNRPPIALALLALASPLLAVHDDDPKALDCPGGCHAGAAPLARSQPGPA